MLDLTTVTDRAADLVESIPEEALGDPTPCPDYTVGDLAEHVGGLALAFAWAARKEHLDAMREPPRPGDATLLVDGWRARIADDLRRLGQAWSDPDAWSGMTRVGGVDLPGEVAGLVALDEVVVHGWDLARATGQPYEVGEDALRANLAFVSTFDASNRGAAFGPPVPVADDAPLLDRVVAGTGRDPAWSPAP